MKVYLSTTTLLLSFTSMMISSTIAASPNSAGTSAIIHVGVATQLDSISQKGTPANMRQQPSRQAAFWSFEHCYDI